MAVIILAQKGKAIVWSALRKAAPASAESSSKGSLIRAKFNFTDYPGPVRRDNILQITPESL
jgi:hypothetical protein